jgi:hypothetical protein
MHHSNSDSSGVFNQLLLQNKNTSLTGRSKDYDSINLSLLFSTFYLSSIGQFECGY